jgi:nucleoside-diphosphate-sugar epimerase
MSRVLVTGGAGYLGSLLTPALLDHGHEVTVIDWFLFGNTLPASPMLTKYHADLRSFNPSVLAGQDAVIHLACVSNDPSSEAFPALTKAVNYDATLRLVRLAKDAGVKRFVFASSSSVYGKKPDDVDVTEDLEIKPLTDYSTYKAMGEDVVLKAQATDFCATVVRPATLCGYAPRLRLDLIVNILTSQAFHAGEMTVYGGQQRRPNLHIKDMVRAYLAILNAPTDTVGGEVFNVGAENATVLELAQLVQTIAGGTIHVSTETNDPRSYMINADKIARVLGFTPQFRIDQAIADLVEAFTAGKVPNALTDARYYNIRQMQACHIS